MDNPVIIGKTNDELEKRLELMKDRYTKIISIKEPVGRYGLWVAEVIEKEVH